MSAHLRADDCGSLYCQRMTDHRNALEKHLGISEQDYSTLPYVRYRTLMGHVGQGCFDGCQGRL